MVFQKLGSFFRPLTLNTRGPLFDFEDVVLFLFIIGVVAVALLGSPAALAGSLPGDDASSKLEAAGTLLKLIDTGLFKWGARIFAGICILSAGWALKEQRFGTAIICVVGALTIGTAPKWVKNIFDVGDNQGLFSMAEKIQVEELA